MQSITSKLEIDIKGYGMGLNQEGSETMVATNLEEYQAVMRFAFRSMTVNEDAHNIGMVYGMEVVPWVNNVAFQVAAKVAEQNIIIPLPRSLIPKATGSPLACQDPIQKMDMYNYCCEEGALYKHAEAIYPYLQTPVPSNPCGNNNGNCVCRPVQNLDKSLVKDNMANNGEFVARLDMAMRYKLAFISALEKCINAVRAVHKDDYKKKLKANDSVKYDKAVTVDYSVLMLKAAIDPLQNFGLVTVLANELDEWIEMFISPCMGALYGMKSGSSPDTETSYFMAYPWYSHSECMMLSCIVSGMRWDREKGGCIPGAAMGKSASDYTDTDAGAKRCALKKDPNIGNTINKDSCKHLTLDMHNFQDKAKKCWTKANVDVGLDHVVNHYCNPQVTENDHPNHATLQADYDLECKNPTAKPVTA